MCRFILVTTAAPVTNSVLLCCAAGVSSPLQIWSRALTSSGLVEIMQHQLSSSIIAFVACQPRPSRGLPAKAAGLRHGASPVVCGSCSIRLLLGGFGVCRMCYLLSLEAKPLCPCFFAACDSLLAPTLAHWVCMDAWIFSSFTHWVPNIT